MIPTTWRLVHKAAVMWRAEVKAAAAAAAAAAPASASTEDDDDACTRRWVSSISTHEERLLDAPLGRLSIAAAPSMELGSRVSGAITDRQQSEQIQEEPEKQQQQQQQQPPKQEPQQKRASLTHQLRRVLAEEVATLPLYHVLLLAAALAALLATRLAATLAVPCGGGAYWGVTVAIIPALLGVWLVARYHVLWKTRVLVGAMTAGLDLESVAASVQRARCGCLCSRRGGGGGVDCNAASCRSQDSNPSVDPEAQKALPGSIGQQPPAEELVERVRQCMQQFGRVEWTRTNTISLPAFCVVAGILAGLLGLGGGIVLVGCWLQSWALMRGGGQHVLRGGGCCLGVLVAETSAEQHQPGRVACPPSPSHS